MSNSKNQRDNLTSAIEKLHSAHSLLKTDEELRYSFDPFLVCIHPNSGNADMEQLQKDYKALEEILPVLYELAEELIAERDQHNAKEIPQADCGNRLFAPLKRHPE